jgi:hypothetical protein
MTFYDNINEFFEKNNIIKNIIDEPNIYIFQSKIINEYKNILNGTDEYFEDKVLCAFNEYMDRHDNANEYDDVCNNIIFIYYNSITKLKEYYSAILKKERFYLENHLLIY